jgi:hypothetical protein
VGRRSVTHARQLKVPLISPKSPPALSPGTTRTFLLPLAIVLLLSTYWANPYGFVRLIYDPLFSIRSEVISLDVDITILVEATRRRPTHAFPSTRFSPNKGDPNSLQVRSTSSIILLKGLQHHQALPRHIRRGWKYNGTRAFARSCMGKAMFPSCCRCHWYNCTASPSSPKLWQPLAGNFADFYSTLATCSIFSFCKSSFSEQSTFFKISNGCDAHRRHCHCKGD